jgi:hypothetical protein
MKEVESLKDLLAPEGLVEPTKEVVKAAMERIRLGTIDELNRQSIELKYEQKLFHLSDSYVERTDNGIVSMGDLDSGLFIYESKINKKGVPVRTGFNIQTPRSEDMVTRNNIFHLRSIKPEKMGELATELRNSQIQ